jgi:Family of unknown function (DUF6455)
MLKRVLDQADLMDRVMEAVGVVAARAARMDRGMAWYEARSRCIACPDDQKCRAWLAGLAGTKASLPPTFYSNAAFFRLARQPADDQQMENRHDPSPAALEGALYARDAQSRGRKRT